VPRGPQPGCIVHRATSDADYPISRHPANPRAALRTNHSGVHAPAVGGALKLAWLDPGYRCCRPVSTDSHAFSR
jgi:hypothetical protein